MTAAGEPRTPKGWKRIGDRTYCRSCLGAHFVRRTIAIPVAGLEEADWPAFREALHAAWADTAQCANWMMTELYARDVRRRPGETRLAPMPRAYLYPDARERFPRLAPQSVATLAQEVLSTYRTQRHAILWTGTRSLAHYRFPMPCPVPSQAWALDVEAGQAVASVKLGDRRWRLRLRGGPQMRRQLAALAQLASGEAQPGTILLVPVRGHAGDHRPSDAAMGHARLMVRVSGWFPRALSAPGGHDIRLATGDGTLLRIVGTRWLIDPEPMRRVLATDARRRRAVIVNVKLGHPSRRRNGPRRALSELARRSRQRLADACRTYAALVAREAARLGASAVEYDDRDRAVLPHFPWTDLRRALVTALENRHIALSGVAGAEPVGVLDGAPEEEDSRVPA